jgi:DNA-binding transcriptional regulator YiaG
LKRCQPVDALHCIVYYQGMKKESKTIRTKWDSNRVRALRDHLNLTQSEMAEQLGTRQQTISEWEQGLYKPRGASSTLLTIVAERANFKYEPNVKA